MSKTVLADILEAIQQTSRGAQFYDSGTIDPQPLGLEIEGLGSVTLPLRPKGVRELLAAAQKAPYGKGTRTLIDTSVRDSLEVAASKITLSESWNASVQNVAQVAAERLGLPGERIVAKLYKLLIYQKGGFFLPHRDSEKQRGMVASLIVMLPSSFGGGALLVEHGESEQVFSFEEAAKGERAQYVAFYADCRHEVHRVTRGVRVCLAYNLVVKPQVKRLAAKGKRKPEDGLVAAVSHWTKSMPAKPLVVALEHQYTSAGLEPALLKGNDRDAAEHLIAAADATNCRVHFGQVSRHLLQFADDGSFGRERYWTAREVDISRLEVGETYEDEITIDDWRDAQGKRVSLAPLTLDGSTLVSTIPFEQWKPTSQDYEGYTGNAGNTLDRWYHKSALVLWASEHHFDVLVQMGIESAIETLLKMRKRSARLSGDKSDQVLRECQLLARAIIQGWPSRLYHSGRTGLDAGSGLANFATELPGLEDHCLVDEFLGRVAIGDWQLSLNKLIAKCCRQFGDKKTFAMLRTFLATTPPPDEYGHLPAQGLPVRDAAWLRHVACSPQMAGMSASQMRVLLKIAMKRFGDHMKALTQNANRYAFRSGELDLVLAELLKAALAAGDEVTFARLLDLRRGAPRMFDIRRFDVEVCTDLVNWADKRMDARPDELASWLDEVRNFLQDATASPPRRPDDWARPSDAGCKCGACRQLAEFLKDPIQQSGSVRDRKDALEHVVSQINRQGLDATKKQLDRSTRPFTLHLTKTNGSYQRAVKRYEEDLKLLASLP